MTFPLPLITAFIAAVDDTLTWGGVGRSSTIAKRDWLNKSTSDISQRLVDFLFPPLCVMLTAEYMPNCLR